MPDDCDITVGTAVDCNGNGVPDGCDLQQGASFDCNGNDVPDECELGIPNNCCERGHGPGCSDSDIEACVCAVDAWCCDVTWDGLCVDLVTGLGCGSCTGNDCNVNGIPDDCDLTIGSSGDCNSNGIPDECETDCNTNGVPDECDLAVGTSRDCNVDLILDECDIAAGTSFDCNANGVPDECGEDCNRNGLADECDVAAGSSADCNSNGTPDECEMAVEIVYEIRRAGLVDLPEDCGNGSVFNFDGIGCNLQPGFRWYDSGAAPVVAAEIEFNVGVECHGPDVVHETSLNGFAGVSYPATPRFCSCDLTPGVEVRVRAAADRYEVGGWNTFLITNPATCMGVIPNVEWGEGVYARIRVWHAAEKDCNTNSILDECELGGNDCNTNGLPDGCDIAGGTSADENGNGTPDECEPRLDIKPGSCPNPLNRGSHGVLPAALLGAVHVDAAVIDASSVRLSRADGIGGEVAPNEGPPGPHSVVEDVGTPFGGGGWCDCHGLDGDGIVDLSVHFRTDDLVEVLELNNLTNGDLLELVITGSLLDGTEFASGGDCILIVPPGNSNLNVESSLPGLFIEVTPPDVNSDGSGFANFQRVHVPSTVVTLTAPATRDGFAFAGWEIDGTPVPNVSGAVSVTLVQTETTAEAVYVPVSRSGVPAPSPIPVPRRVPRPVVR